jgi:diguanylate cyclase (GGDEF)-like protein
MVAGGVFVLGANFWLVRTQIESGLARQASELEAFSNQTLATELVSDAALAAARLTMQEADIVHRVTAISQDTEILHAVASFNTTAIATVLSNALANSDIDTAIVVDAKMAPVGDSRNSVGLVGFPELMEKTGLATKLDWILKNSNRISFGHFSQTFLATDQLQQLFGLSSDQAAVQVVIWPIFDDFGDSSGAIIAARGLRKTEVILQSFADIAKVALEVRLAGRLASVAGISNPPELVSPKDGSQLWRSVDNARVGGCITSQAILQVCATRPIQDLYAARDQLIRTGTMEGERLSRRLVWFGVGSVLVFALIAVWLARQITRPIGRITNGVARVAEGDYAVELPDTERRDEVGNIARAVSVLRENMRERDQLRRDTATQNARLRAQETALRLQNDLFDAALNNMSHGLCMFDRDGRLIVHNSRFSELYGFQPGEIVPGVTFDALRQMKSRSLAGSDELTGQGLFGLLEGETSLLHRRIDGRMIEVTRQSMANGGWLSLHEDVTERRRSETKILQMATQDSLTGLANRYVLLQRIETELKQGGIALLCLDLDEFKVVNDTLGHPIGDKLLQIVSERLVEAARPQDLVARLGGDEFAVVLTHIHDESEATALATRLIEAVARPTEIGGSDILPATSIGGALGPRDGATADELMKRADLALYRAKAQGKGAWRFFDPEMELSIKARKALIADIQQALDRREFEPYFQPQIQLDTNRIVGFEALARWHHPTRGMVPPMAFIPIAEETGLIGQIGEQILGQACEIAMTWPAPLRVAVNVSPLQLRDSAIVDKVAQVLARTGLAPGRLELEITESALLDDNAEIRARLLAIKALGVRISMDDFGTGYSSLSCLRNFPFDKIKIDQSFIRPRDDAESSRAIVASVLQMAHNLKISTTAEGVETMEIAEALREGGCDEAQGYLFSAPQPAHVAIGLIERFGPAAPDVSAPSGTVKLRPTTAA